MNHELFEDNTHSFIVKVWLEKATERADQSTWRGHITHVPSGERRYLQDPDEITAFIASYMEQVGAKISVLK
jgi:hypothetical protein